MKKKINLSILFFLVLSCLFSQNNKVKQYFDKSGKSCPAEVANYYRQESDTSGFYRCYFIVNGKLNFQGRIVTADNDNENKNVYTGTCNWYHKNGNPRVIRSFNEKGEEHGNSKYFYESGKIWKELAFNNGKTLENSIVEYDEDGSKNRIFEENFDNNNNEWDLYLSDKSSASISGGVFEIISTSKEGTSRYINHNLESGEFTIEAVLNIGSAKENDKVGIIYGFKDWQNYNYFAITKKNIYIGTMYEGVKDDDVEAMFSSAINPLENNTIKILSNGSKNIYSVNGEIQYTSNSRKLFGNNFGFVLGGNAKVKVDKFVIKELGINSVSKSIASDDKDVKSFGSGVIFSSEGYIVTNHHVVDNAEKFVVEIIEASGKKSYNAELVTKDKENDLAIIRIKDPAFAGLPTIKYSFKENGQLDVGGSVFTIGYPHALTGMGKDAKFTDGKISAKTGYDGAINSFQSTIPVQPGNSGGPVFNEAGQLIGVINSGIMNADNVAYAIKLNYIKNLIEILPDKINLPSDNTIQTISLEEKIKVLMNYVVLIKIK